MFQLTPEEKAEVVANCDHLAVLKFSPSLPYAFTAMTLGMPQAAQHGAVMAAIRSLITPPAPKRTKIGFATGPDENIARDRPARQHRKR